MPPVKKLWTRRNYQIFVWPGEEMLELSYNAIRIVVPARDAVARINPGLPYTHEAAVLNGKPLPGTAFVEDITVQTPERGYQHVLQIGQVCEYLTRDRDDLFNRGFNIVGEPEGVKEAMLLGIPLWEESQVVRAREILARELSRQKAYRDRGEIPPPSTSEHLISWAVRHLKNRPQQQAHRLEDISAALEGREVEPTLLRVPSAPAPEAESEEAHVGLEVKAAEVMAVFAEAKHLGVKLSAIEMQHLLSGNAQMLATLKTKCEMRRVELKAAASA